MQIPGVPQDLIHRASLQGGLLSRQQFAAGGVSGQRLTTLCRKDVADRVTRNVYALPSISAQNNSYQLMDARSWQRVRSAWTGLLSAPQSIATGMAALVLHDVWGLPTVIQPEIAMPGGGQTTGAKGVRVRQFRRAFPVQIIHGRKVAAPEYALAQALPELRFRTAVAVMDSALNRKLIVAWQVDKVRAEMRGKPGVRQLGPWWRAIDGRAGSPMETIARLDCHDAGLRAPVLQAEVRNDRGEVIARGDLGWMRPDRSWVLVEIDGRQFHDNPEAVFHDRLRQNAMLLSGRHTLLRFTGRDVLNGKVPGAVRTALDM